MVQSEKKLESIFKVAPIGIGVVNDRILTEVNSRICEMTGYTLKELIGSSARILYPDQEEHEYVGREKYRQIAEKGTGTVETKWKRKDGSIIDVLLSSTPIDPDDHSCGVTFTALDITERKQAEEELRASEEKFRLLVTQMQQGLAVHEVICDGSGMVVDYRFLDVNEAFENHTGLKRENILGKTVLGVLPNIEASWIEKCGHVALTGEPLYLEEYAAELDRYYRVVAYQIVPGQFATIVTDISENKKHEDALRVIAETSSSRDEELFAVLVQQLALSQKLYCVLISSMDTERPNTATTLALWMDGKLIDNFDYSLEGTPCYDVMNGDVCFHSSDICKLFPDDHILEEMGAKSYWGTPLKDSKGKVLGLIAIIDNRPMDKSPRLLSLLSSFAARVSAEMERQVAEKELEKTEQMFKLFFDQAAVGVTQVSPDGRFLRINKRFCEITGFSFDEIMSSNFRDITHPDDLPLEEKYILEIMTNKRDSYEIEKRYINKKGHIVWIRLYSNVIRDIDGSVLYATAVVVDISDQRNAKEALIYAKALADESNRIKSEILNNVTHELRTPLTAVIGFSDQLLHENEEEADERQKRYLEYIHQSGEDLLSIVNRMLDYANLEYKLSDSLKLQPVDISDVVHDTASVLLAKASKKNVQLNTMIDPGLKTVVADKGKLESILYNLVENAIKFTDNAGTVTIRASAGNDDTAIFSVQDTGIGIEKDKLDTIFEAFTQVDGSVSRKYGGTGLGLALVRKLVEMHDGHIRVESEPGKGSDFIFEIPITPK